MRVVHDDLVTLPGNARELALAVKNGEELNNLLSLRNNKLRVACCQTSIKSYFHSRKKQEWI